MKAWHFVNDTLRDGSPIPEVGQVLKHDGELIMCQSGLHASVRIIDALQYAPGAEICRVECGGEIKHQDDKLVCSERTILWRVDGEELLREFARKCALDVIHLWDAPDVVKEYLETGDESLRDAARAAARDASRDASWAAAGDAWAVAGDVGEAARAAAWDAAWDAWAAAGDAAWVAAGNASAAAAWAAARGAQNERLEQMIKGARK